MARRDPAAIAPGDRGAGMLGSAEFGAILGIGRVHTVRSLCARGLVPGAGKVGKDWRIDFPVFYEALAGPGVPVGRIVTSAWLARRLRASSWTIRRSSAPPGTPDKIPGLQVGKTWYYAVPAVQARYPEWPLDDPGVPGSPAAAGQRTASGPGSPGPAHQPGPPPAVFRAPAALDYPAGAAAQPAASRTPARSGGPAARRPRPGPGRSPAPR
jgi:hypothetical protein